MLIHADGCCSEHDGTLSILKVNVIVIVKVIHAGIWFESASSCTLLSARRRCNQPAVFSRNLASGINGMIKYFRLTEYYGRFWCRKFVVGLRSISDVVSHVLRYTFYQTAATTVIVLCVNVMNVLLKIKRDNKNFFERQLFEDTY